MENQLITAEDMDYFAKQSAGNLNMIISGMTAIMKDTDNKVSQLEDQTWFQRMSNTLTGKNKMTLVEIQQNHEQINKYMTEALSNLYNRNMMDHQIMIGLGNQINEVYAEQIQLKEMLGAFVNKLNEKIISIDNFHMLVEEINQNVFSNEPAIVAVSKIVTQIDLHTARDQRKMEILSRSLTQAGIVNEKAEALIDVLVELLSVSENDAGLISMFLMGVENDYLSEIIAGALYEYYGMPERIRKFKNKRSVIENYLTSKQIDDNMMISTQEIYSSIIEAYSNSMIEYAIQVESNHMIEEKRNEIIEYLRTILKFIKIIVYGVDQLDNCTGEMVDYKRAIEFEEYYKKLKEEIKSGSYIGNTILKNANNISSFVEKLMKKYDKESFFYDIKPNPLKLYNESSPNKHFPQILCSGRYSRSCYIDNGFTFLTDDGKITISEGIAPIELLDAIRKKLTERDKLVTIENIDLGYTLYQSHNLDCDDSLQEFFDNINNWEYCGWHDTMIRFENCFRAGYMRDVLIENNMLDSELGKIWINDEMCGKHIVYKYHCMYAMLFNEIINRLPYTEGDALDTLYSLIQKYDIEYPESMYESIFLRKEEYSVICIETEPYKVEMGSCKCDSNKVRVYIKGINVYRPMTIFCITNEGEYGGSFCSVKWGDCVESIDGSSVFEIDVEYLQSYGKALYCIKLQDDPSVKAYLTFEKKEEEATD